jgi:hypothetical protein
LNKAYLHVSVEISKRGGEGRAGNRVETNKIN